MKTISFHELYTLDFELSDLFGQKQKWIKGVLFRMDHPRHSSAVIYLNRMPTANIPTSAES